MTRAIAALLLLYLAPPVGSISGVILDETNDRPIARAVVTMIGTGVRPNAVAITGVDGRFLFSGLAAGQFTLSASKSTFLTMAYGQTVAGRGSGLPISLRDGEQLSGLTWKLPRGGVITGAVRDGTGQPMRDIPIVLMQYRMVNDRRTLQNVSCCVYPETDSAGKYRIAGVVPGDYVISAIPPGGYNFVPSGPFSASEEIRSVDPAEMQWALRQVGTSGALTGGVPPAPAAEPPESRPLAYIRVYHPGAIDESGAAVVNVKAGEERHGIDLVMKPERVARIEGTIVGPDGKTPASISITKGEATTSGGANVGTFSFRNLGPGRHTIIARAAGPLWGSIDVDLRGEDVLGVVLRLERGATIAGRVVFESAGGTAPAADPTLARLNVRPLSPMLRALPAGADGAFSLTGIDPGHYRMTATIAAAADAVGRGAAAGAAPAASASTITWVLKSVMWNGRDIADMPFDIRPGDDLSGVVVTYTDRATELSGTLFDTSGQAAPGFYVAVFPTDASLWAAGSRRMPAPVRAATDGRFRFVGLPAGSYYAVALTNADPADLADTAFLKQLAASALTITLGEGEKKVQDLKFAPPRRPGE